MLNSGRWAVLRSTVASLGVCALMAHSAGASTIDTTSTTDATTTAATTAPISVPSSMNYATSGSIGLTGITGPNVISFIPEVSGAFTTPSAFSLGSFVVGYLPSGISTTYNQTPFSLTYTTLNVDGTSPTPNESPITITGFLNGTIAGSSQSGVVATFDPIKYSSFLTGSFINNLSVLDPQVSLVPSTTNGGRTTAQAHLTTSPGPPIPEPTTIALFATAIVGFGLKKRFGRGSKLA